MTHLSYNDQPTRNDCRKPLEGMTVTSPQKFNIKMRDVYSICRSPGVLLHLYRTRNFTV